LVDIQNGSDHKHIEQDEGYPVIGSGGQFAYASEFMYDGESVLLGRKGTIDKPLYVLGKFWTVDTMYWTKIAPDACGRYAYYLALNIPFDYYSTNTALPSMTKGALHAHMVSRPPLPEQTQIAVFLDRETAKIDELVAEQRRLVALLKEKRQAVISHAVTRGLNPDAPLKPSGIEWLGDVPEHWRVVNLSAMVECAQLGGNLDSSESEEGIPVIKMGNLDRGFVKTNKIEFLAVGAQYDESLLLKHGDFLFNTRNSLDLVGKVAMWREELPVALYNSNVLRIGFRKESAIPAYMNYFFNSDLGLSQLRMIAKGTTSVAAIYYKDLASLQITVPPLEEQHSIAKELDVAGANLNGLILEAQRAIDLLQERRTALISAAVTGQIDVRGAVAA
jgi:type I restriction enzyme S subunit